MTGGRRPPTMDASDPVQQHPRRATHETTVPHARHGRRSSWEHAAPAVLAAGPTIDQDKEVLIAFNGDVTVPTGEQADVVLVTNGTATISGDVKNVAVFDG